MVNYRSPCIQHANQKTNKRVSDFCLRNLEVFLEGRAILLPLHLRLQERDGVCGICLNQSDIYDPKFYLKTQKSLWQPHGNVEIKASKLSIIQSYSYLKNCLCSPQWKPRRSYMKLSCCILLRIWRSGRTDMSLSKMTTVWIASRLKR